ncbi:TetR/AcrR family transcriptional regulator [Aquabacter spiritensis]|uniref:TetR family transcriptional regulator n=1 Tax=Aquabacter spiritensis TaxID=933073 RepID=A0A4R3M1U2_9HYPH|nr:TetR/AcrR family transcriptional regulator [Aquabacter spiritensis]TCT06693.1 TetR family transcriptional regulator [Aquabacter spiritensis]
MAGVRRFDEEDVLAKAEAVFRAKGFGATSMLDLACATGVQRGSLYHAYGDKEELFLRTFGRYEARFLATVAQALEGPDIRLALQAFLEAAIDNMTSGSPAPGCLSTRTAGEPTGARIRTEVRGLLDGLDAILMAALARPGAAERLAVPAEAAARLVVTFTRGLAVMERVYGDPAALRATARTLVDLLVPPDPAV